MVHLIIKHTVYNMALNTYDNIKSFQQDQINTIKSEYIEYEALLNSTIQPRAVFFI